MKIKIYSLAILSLFLLALPIALSAGLAISPASIKISNLMRGMEFNKTLTISNPGDSEQTFLISVVGETTGWIYFYSAKTGEQIDRITVPAKSIENVIANFKIPEYAANGKYSSKIYVGAAPDTTTEGNTSGFSIRIPIDVSLGIIGEQFESGSVINISTKDTEINKLMRIEIEFQNTGNVIAKPRIDIVIKKNEAVVANFTHNDTGVDVGNTSKIDVYWDSTGQTIGDYVANVKVYVNDDRIENKNLVFKLLERGSLTASGEITNVTTQNNVNLGEVAKIEANFMNTGEIDVSAKISGEIYSGGSLIDTINGDEVLVKTGSSEMLTAYYKPGSAGTYTIKASVNYEGKTITMNDMQLNVKTAAGGTSEPGSITGMITTTNIILGGVVVILLISALVIYRIKTRTGTKSGYAYKIRAR